MLRPVGRYFAPLNSKMQSLKKEESIVIDQAFKLRLRENLLMKIASMPSPETQKKASFFERLFQWRYQLAAVPTLLLMVVTAYGLRSFNFELPFKQSEVVPAVVVEEKLPENSEDSSSGISFDSSDFDQTDGQSLQDKSPDIKTFSGAKVMPPKILQNNISNGENQVSPLPSNVSNSSTSSRGANVDSSALQDGTLKTTSSSVPAPTAPVAPTTSGGASSTASSGSSPSPLDSAKVAEPAGTAPTTPVNPTSLPASTPVVSPSVSTPTPTVSPTVGQQTPAASVSDPKLLAPLSTSTPLSTKSPSTSTLAPVTSVPAPTLRETTTTATTTLSKLVDPKVSTPLVLKTASYPVYYNGLFSAEQKTYFEQQIVPSLKGGKTLTKAVIRLVNATKVTVEMDFGANNIQTFTYVLDATTKTWKLESGAR